MAFKDRFKPKNAIRNALMGMTIGLVGCYKDLEYFGLLPFLVELSVFAVLGILIDPFSLTRKKGKVKEKVDESIKESKPLYGTPNAPKFKLKHLLFILFVMALIYLLFFMKT